MFFKASGVLGFAVAECVSATPIKIPSCFVTANGSKFQLDEFLILIVWIGSIIFQNPAEEHRDPATRIQLSIPTDYQNMAAKAPGSPKTPLEVKQRRPRVHLQAFAEKLGANFGPTTAEWMSILSISVVNVRTTHAQVLTAATTLGLPNKSNSSSTRPRSSTPIKTMPGPSSPTTVSPQLSWPGNSQMSMRRILDGKLGQGTSIFHLEDNDGFTIYTDYRGVRELVYKLAKGVERLNKENTTHEDVT
ncbi:hypothetical protein HOY80DRAFT_1035353 [Tuber brumale]|nr:hypothetical protein HOY80DRAFT_1035353 [Tuber brumale]